MKELSEVKTWPELLDFIENDNFGLNLREIAKDILGISEKSFYDIKRGKIPQKQLFRKIAGYLKTKHNVIIKQGEGINIRISDNINITGDKNLVRDSQNIYKSNQDDKVIIKFLMDEIADYKNEIKKLRCKCNKQNNPNSTKPT